MPNLMDPTDHQVHKLNGIGCKLFAYLKCAAAIAATFIDTAFATNLYIFLKKGELGYAVVGAFGVAMAWDRLLSIIILWRNDATVLSGEKQVGVYPYLIPFFLGSASFDCTLGRINKFKATLQRNVGFAEVVLVVFKGFVSVVAFIKYEPTSTKGEQLDDKFALKIWLYLGATCVLLLLWVVETVESCCHNCMEDEENILNHIDGFAIAHK
ncbi:hypothetical protein BDR26DRAFT_871977 [Obelidium mucronatum]|nr:hypothetical protein BDR26DRAFT_871977 [Obelidium mucronatum]